MEKHILEQYTDLQKEHEDLIRRIRNLEYNLEKMVQLLGKIRKVEKYHWERTYIPRVKD